MYHEHSDKHKYWLVRMFNISLKRGITFYDPSFSCRAHNYITVLFQTVPIVSSSEDILNYMTLSKRHYL